MANGTHIRLRALTLLFVCFMSAGWFPTSACGEDQLTFGVRTGLGYSRPKAEELFAHRYDRRLATSVSVQAVYHYHPEFEIQLELSFMRMRVDRESFEGAPLGEATFLEKVRLSYVEIPVLARFPLPLEGPVSTAFFAGPAVSLYLGGTNSVSYTVTSSGTVVEGMTSGDIGNVDWIFPGALIGGELGISLGETYRLLIDMRYRYSVFNPFKTAEPDQFLSDDIIPFIEQFTLDAPELGLDQFSVSVGLTLPW